MSDGIRPQGAQATKPELFTRAFWYSATDRAIKSAIQGFTLALAQSATGLIGLDWRVVLVNSLGMALLSLGMNISGIKLGAPGSAEWIGPARR